jgi:CubicO group peptidase (beta-lactamase class C family)/pimeloyl-ACP methyl ester carboxylesterase
VKSSAAAVVLSCLIATLAGAQPSDQFFDSNGVRVRYLVVGQGEPVVLVHPFATSAEIWADVTRGLSGSYRVIAMDCRGHGRSDKPHDPSQYGIEMVNDVMRLLDHLQIARAAVVGYSMGGSIAMKLLAEHPDRIRVAVIGGSLGFSRDESEHDETPRLGPNLLSGMPLSEAMVESAPPGWPKPGPEQREMMKRMDAGQDPVALGAETVSHQGLWVEDQQLRAISVPTLILHGGDDRPAFFEKARQRFPNLQFRSIEGVGHGPALQSPEFLRDVRDFLDQHRSSSQDLPADTPAARQLSAWLQAYNSGDRARLLAFLKTAYPAHVPDVDQQIQRRLNVTGGYDLEKTEKVTATEFSGVVKMRDLEQYVRVTLQVAPTAPHEVVDMRLEMIARPAEFPSVRVGEASALRALEAKLRSETAADRFAGAVLVAKNGKPIFSGAYGLADREKKIPNQPDTCFRLGSMNKIVTAVAVLQLAQAGKIDLEAPIGKYLRDYPNQEVASKVKVKHLLMHAAGTGDIFGPQYDSHRNELRTLQDYVSLYGSRGLEFEPGSRWAYSNYGFVLLGVLIEKVTGQNYCDYVDDHVYEPAGMVATGSQPESEAVSCRPVAYTHGTSGSTWRPNEESLPYRGTSAGGGYSTVGDLLRFANALTERRLLDEPHLRLLVDGEALSPGGPTRAYGSGGRTWDGVRYFGHNGGYPGMNGDLEMSLESGYVIVVLSNLDPPAAQRISEFIGSRLPER